MFWVLLLAGAAYVGLTSAALPDTLAAHFDGAGRANGFMPRSNYRTFMLAMVIGAPLLAVTGMSRAYRGARRPLKLPNGDYWLAPQRREGSIAFLVAHAQWFGCLLVLFLCRVHWMVVQANTLQPPNLPFGTAMSALALFGGGLMLWFGTLMIRFQRPRGL